MANEIRVSRFGMTKRGSLIKEGYRQTARIRKPQSIRWTAGSWWL